MMDGAIYEVKTEGRIYKNGPKCISCCTLYRHVDDSLTSKIHTDR